MLRPEIFLGVELSDLLDVGGAGGRDDRLPLEIIEFFEVGGFLRHETVGRDEMCDGEGDLFLPLEIVGGRAALQVGGAICQQRDAGGRSDRLQLDLELGELEVRLHCIDDLVAEVHGITDHLLLVVVI